MHYCVPKLSFQRDMLRYFLYRPGTVEFTVSLSTFNCLFLSPFVYIGVFYFQINFKVVKHIEMPKAGPKKSICHFQILEMILKCNKQNTVRLPQKYNDRG